MVTGLYCAVSCTELMHTPKQDCVFMYIAILKAHVLIDNNNNDDDDDDGKDDTTAVCTAIATDKIRGRLLLLLLQRSPLSCIAPGGRQTDSFCSAR